ncbi:cytochrome d ubiquinol oxidase subunit II [Edaphobacter modestus]|uniref:Cytochrome bd-I ubiquinol oxidase subunit 2 apoprotein n=1 Tax=Edaphobacter modestus TaxID=388466 RepID=A0A4Q7YPP9_9BACT|nr:cytochrome d ubiquinol oxidase subunit II [Edaphobacter modestus]RZU38841.1 cytochrome bd-I ubiquinol oxidase subunit 2 apoprotein [Edaphobacter modestus]
MPSPQIILTLILMASLTFYALFGGADYGGGVWDLLARGPRQREQRELIANAITPVWEANHVWLILVIVLLFSGFPLAFADVTTALHVPLTALIVGIVMRGSSFIFRAYHTGDYRIQRRWGLIFAVASTITPICLGIVVGAISSGNMVVSNGISENGFFDPWLGWFPLMVGFFALSLFVFLAAVFLTLEAQDHLLQEDFRKRALLSGVAVAAMALATFLTARHGAPDIYRGLLRPSIVWVVQGATAICACVAFICLLARRYKAARVAAMLQITCILWGWGVSQAPYLLQGKMTIAEAAASPSVLWALIGATGVGVILLFPSLWYLLSLFKTGDEHLPLH